MNPDALSALDASLEGPGFPRRAVTAFSRALAPRWPGIEEALLGAARQPSFRRYLSKFRGLALAPPPLEEQASVQEAVGEPLFVLLKEAFVEGLAGAVAAGVPVTQAACCYEALVNLLLFLWSGEGDRNFQFRTVVHFGGLEGLGDDLVESPEPVTLAFVEHGIRLAHSGIEAEHFPLRLPLSHVLVDEDFLTLVAQPPSLERDAALLARVRSFQRELCLLVDDWEHENALLAVEHTRIRQSYQAAAPAKLEEALGEILGRMGILRDALALWCTGSFTICQRALALVSESKPAPDLDAEVDATQAVLLAALQKIHLPASVSRHRYDAGVFRQLAAWCEERLRTRSDDAATRLTRLTRFAARAATGLPVDWADLVALLSARSYEWTLDYDPSSGLKACSWRLPPQAHVALCGLFVLLVARKLHPTPPSALWYATAASLVQMPDTFPTNGPSAMERGFVNLEPGAVPAPPAAFVATLSVEVRAILDRAPPTVDADCVAYLRAAFPVEQGNIEGTGGGTL